MLPCHGDPLIFTSKSPTGTPSLLPPATFILLPPPPLQSEPMQISREALPVQRDPLQIPMETFPVTRDPVQMPKEPSESMQTTEPREILRNSLNVEMDTDIAKSLYSQSLALNKLAEVIGERNVMLEKFIYCESGQHEKLAKVVEQRFKDQDEIRALVEEQNKLVQDQLRLQNEQMLRVLEAARRSHEQHHKKMQDMKQQMLTMQQQLVCWAQDWVEQQKQQAVNHEILDTLRNMQEN